MSKTTKICLNCGREFTPKKHHGTSQRFCDIFCRVAYKYKHRDDAKVKRLKKELIKGDKDRGK